jgi:hypothetical protein
MSLIFVFVVTLAFAQDEKEVIVINADPLPVVVEENFRRIPFQEQKQSLQLDNAINVTHSYRVPNGFILVIESFSASGTLPTRQVLRRSSITTTASGASAEHHFNLSKVSEIDNYKHYSGLHSVRLYADSGTNVDIQIVKQNVASGKLTVFTSISGYLIPEGATRLGP